MKKVWGISASMVGTIAVVASVAGCGSTQNDTNASGTGNPSTTTASTGSSSQPVTITFWYGVGDTLSTDIQQMVSEFNKTHPNIKVVATYQGSYSVAARSNKNCWRPLRREIHPISRKSKSTRCHSSRRAGNWPICPH